MKARKLGELEVSAMGLGCMGLSEFYGERDGVESRATILHAVDRGVTFFDTADMYGVGDNERLVGAALRLVRDRVVLATKSGIVRKREDPSLRAICGRPDYVYSACDASLRRLGVGLVAYSPLGRGFLTGTIASAASLSPGDFGLDLLPQLWRLIEKTP